MSDVELILGAYPRIHFACQALVVRDEASGTNPSAHQVRILSHLDAEDPTMVTELAEYMGVTASTMSLNLKRLVEAGLISRERDPEDRRVMNVRLTSTGLHIRDSATVLDPERVDAMLRRLPPEERQRAVQGMTLLAEAADDLVSRKAAPAGPLQGGTGWR